MNMKIKNAEDGKRRSARLQRKTGLWAGADAGFRFATQGGPIDSSCTSTCTGTCFVEGTQISLAGGKSVSVEDLADASHAALVCRPDGNTNEILRISIRKHKGTVIRIWTEEDHVLTVTELHPMLAWTGEEFIIVPARSLELGHSLLLVDPDRNVRRIVRMVKRESISYEGLVYNFGLNGDTSDVRNHLLIADGLVTGDMTLQESIARKSKRDAILAE